MQPENKAFQAGDFCAWALCVLLLVLVSPASSRDVDSHRSAHAKIGCGECHGAAGNAGTAAGAGSSPVETDRLSSRCVTCHGSHQVAGATNNPFHQRDGRACVACHSFHDPAVIRAGDREFSVRLGNPRNQGHCRSCHVPGTEVAQLVGGHRYAADAVYHNDAFDLAELSPSDACLLCHSRDLPAVTLPSDLAPGPRFHAEASHPFGVPVRSGPGAGAARIRPDLDPRIPLPDGKIECQTCHLVTSATRKLLLPFDDPYSLCLGCHQVRQPAARDPGPLVVSDAGAPARTGRRSP